VTVDIIQVLDQLNLERVAVVGWSAGGGRYALCLGALAPNRVTAIAASAGQLNRLPNWMIHLK
jgi:pimeloyl-ACP methyl ester carboxylesterase